MASADPSAGIRVLLVDDQALIRAGNTLVIDSAPGLVVVGEAATGEEAVRLAGLLRPDVVLMDVRMPGMGGIEACRRIVAANPAVRVVVLTTFDLDEYAFGGLEAGASGFLIKTAAPEVLVEAIRTVAGGDAVLAPRATRRLIETRVAVDRDGVDRGAASGPPHPATVLSPREYDVFQGIASGLANQEIAAELTLSLPTIKSHVNRILAKLGARDRVQLVIIAYRHGCVPHE